MKPIAISALLSAVALFAACGSGEKGTPGEGSPGVSVGAPANEGGTPAAETKTVVLDVAGMT